MTGEEGGSVEVVIPGEETAEKDEEGGEQDT